MTSDDRDEPVLLPRKGALMLVIPLLAIPVVFVAWAAFLWRATQPGSLDGDLVRIEVRTCPEAAPLLDARAEEIGIAGTFSPTDGGLVLTTRLPSEPRRAERIPRSLVVPGALEVRGSDGQILFDNRGVAEATVRLDASLRASALLRPTADASAIVDRWAAANPTGDVRFFLDGAPVGHQPVGKLSPGELEIWRDGIDDLTRMDDAAEQAVVIDHGPLPCPAELGAVTRVGD